MKRPLKSCALVLIAFILLTAGTTLYSQANTGSSTASCTVASGRDAGGVESDREQTRRDGAGFPRG
jgi:hypothetical protein